MCLSKVLAILTLITILLNLSLTSDHSFICDQVLRQENFDADFAWYSTKCELNSYIFNNIVECLDKLRTQIQLNGELTHFAFLGDSRIRSAFHSFWTAFPDYDFTWKGDIVDRKSLAYHHDIDIESSILKIRISYYWRPTIPEGLQQFRKWLDRLQNAPSVLITGFGSHHMSQNLPLSYIEYEKLMTNLTAVLESLSSKTIVYWWHQNPIIETYGTKRYGIIRSTTNGKMENYNIIAHRILRNTSVHYWASTFRMAEEYVRSCSINERTDVSNLRVCADYIHTGYLIYDRGTQVLFNSMCNRLLTKSDNPSVILKPNSCCSQSLQCSSSGVCKTRL